MKKVISLFLAVCSLLIVLCGCEKEPTYYVQSEDPIESYDNESRIVVEGSETEDSSAHVPAEGEFVVKGKKYVYQLLENLPPEDVVVLSVANETEKNYEVTVAITYLDENGAVLKEESQTYQDIAAGNSTYYVFRPKIAFAEYRYSLSVEEHEGPCYLSNMVPYEWNVEDAYLKVWKAHVGELVMQGDYTMYNQLTTRIPFKNENDIYIYARMHIIIFDNRGEIAYLGSTAKQTNAGELIKADTTIYYTLDDISVNQDSWPEHLQGEIQAMVIPFRAMTKEEAEQEIGRPLG